MKTEIWNGVGLPPIGTDCDVRIANGDWKHATILFVGKEICVFRTLIEWKERGANLANLEFRLCRTAEKIAEDERKAETFTRAIYQDAGIEPELAERLFAKGYRREAP